MMKEALFYDRISDIVVQCALCPYLCSISPSRHGQCGVRTNRNGKLFSMTYGRISTEMVLPIEALPLYHFHPGSKVLLIGTLGCNLRCPFCNTWRVSQAGARTRFVSPEDLLNIAKTREVDGVAFGVNEPVVYYEYIMETAPLLRNAGLFVVVATNGFISEPPLFDLLAVVDAFLVDVKGFVDTFYQTVTGGYRDEVLKTILSINIKKPLEVSALIIERHNDDENALDKFFRWVAMLQPAPPPLHLLQYEPAFQYIEPATTPMRMYYLQEKARRLLHYVYLSNMDEREAKVTYCPSCREVLIVREKGATHFEKMLHNSCSSCGKVIPIVL